MKLLVATLSINNGAFTSRFLDSIYPSTKNDVEIYVVDQGSQGDTVKWLENYAQPHGVPMMKVFKGRNIGVAAGWNDCAEEAFNRGCEAVLICGNDTQMKPWTIDRIANAMDRVGYGIVSGNEKKGWSDESWAAMTEPEPASPEPGKDPAINFSFFLLSRRLFEAVGPFDREFWPAYFEDNDFHWRLLQAGFEGTSVIDATFRHGDASNGGSQTIKSGGMANEVRVHFDKNKARFRAKHGTDNTSAINVPRERREKNEDGSWKMDPLTKAAQDRLARYSRLCAERSDINEHLPTLHRLANECDHVTEMGTRTAVSTTALLISQPKKLVCYDTCRHPEVDQLPPMAGRTEFVFHNVDVLQVEIEETDMLFIDTLHTATQLRQELDRHAGKAKKILAFHDTVTFGEKGEDGQSPGLMGPIREFLAQNKEWSVAEDHRNNNGLLVLRRASS